MQTPGKCISKEGYRFYIFHPTEDCIDQLPFDIVEDDGDYYISFGDGREDIIVDGEYIVEKEDDIDVVCEENFKLKYNVI